jgi:hypothetical protein
MSNTDWTGNSKSIYTPLGASNHTAGSRALDDYYATDPKAVELLLSVEKFHANIWEPACGGGHITNVLVKEGYSVIATDIADRGVGADVYDFLILDDNMYDIDIITNPPYKYASEFIEQALKLVNVGRKVAMFLKVQFLEGKKRKILFQKHPPKVIYVSSSRLLCAKNGEFQKMIESGGSAVAYAWFIWVKGYQGDTILKWIN